MKETTTYLIDKLNQIERYSKKNCVLKENTFKIILKITISLNEAKKYYKKESNKILKTEIDKQYLITDFPKGESFSYVTDDIVHKIKESYKYGIKYEFEIKEQKITVNLLYCLDKDKENKLIKQIQLEKVEKEKVKKMFDYYIYKIYLWLYIANKEKDKKCSQNINIYIYLTNLIKLIPTNKGETLNTIHSNSAFTTSCQKNTEIHLYREEDWFKTLIHETFHCFGFDFSGDTYLKDYSKKEILKKYTIDSEINLYEVYCELWAEFINVIMYIFFKNNHGTTINYGKYNELIFYEQQFSIFQSAKILKHYNINYNDLKNNTEILKKKFKENTNIFAYYILKSIYMFYINDFIDFIILHNKTPFNFDKTKDTIDAFLNIVLKINTHQSNKLFETKFNKMFNYNIENKNFESITMKMNLLEF